MNETAPATPLSPAARLPRNWTVRWSLSVLGVIALLCLIGPLFSGHPYDQVYRDYVLVGPSVFAHPDADEVEGAIAAIARRMHVAIKASRDGEMLHLTLDAEKPIDPRALRSFERSDLFGPALIAATTDEGRRLETNVPVKRTVFLFGTDANGRDLFTRVLIAGRISLAVGLLASFVAMTIGVAYGAVAGYIGGYTDNLMMRAVEIIYALPFIFFVIVLVMVFGRQFVLIFVAIGAVEWLDMARIVRGQTLSIKQRDFIAAAEALGAKTPAILWRHVIPNASGPIIAYLTVLVPRVILLESFVSFLGLGVQEPLTSWGVLVADGARNIQGSLHLLIFSALFLGVTLGALQSLGDGFRAHGSRSR
jgi:oligopeptide transport system permease protein